MAASSGSSESEDDSAFREACDPTLSDVYHTNIITNNDGGIIPHPREKNNEENDKRQETRESFLLFNKIEASLSSARNTNGVCTNGRKVDKRRGSLGTSGHRRRKNITFSGADAPSPLSAYLAKQLTGLLDKNVEIAANPEGSFDNPAWRDEARKPSIRLLKNFTYENFTKQESEGVPEKSRKLKQKKFSHSDSSDEEEVASKCRLLALSPQSILDKSDDYPWPHPRNIRYLEKYKVKNRGANGSILAVAYNETCKTTVRTSSDCLSQEINGNIDCEMKGRHEIKNDCDRTKNIKTMNDIQCVAHRSEEYQNRRKIDDTESKVRARIRSVEISHKAETGCKEGTDVTLKIRKQSRKRGKKKKQNGKCEIDGQTSV